MKNKIKKLKFIFGRFNEKENENESLIIGTTKNHQIFWRLIDIRMNQCES